MTRQSRRKTNQGEDEFQSPFGRLRATSHRCGICFFVLRHRKTAQRDFAVCSGLEKDFAKTWLPSATVYFFGLVLPFLEVIIGTLLILGLFTRLAAVFGGIVLTVLTTGLVIAGNSGGVAHNLIYSIIFFLLLYHADENGFCLDRKFGDRACK